MILSRFFLLLLAFYCNAGHVGPRRFRRIERATYYTELAASELNIQDQTGTMLSMWVCESDFNPRCVGQFGERGIEQSKPEEFHRWRRFWMQREVDLGPFDEIRTQMYFGVAEYDTKLLLAHGDVRQAVRRYNGSGGKACCYADRVLALRNLIFHY